MPPRHARAVAHLRAADPVLRDWIDHEGPCRFRVHAEGSHFDHIARSIVFQQLSTAAATTIYKRFVERFGGTAPTPRQLLRAPEQTLREVGLSGRKVEYLRDLATQALSPRSPIHRLHEMTDDEVMTHLTALRGIGVWTTQMVLMFRLGRLDILPTADLVIQKGVKILYGLRTMPTQERLERIGKPWAPYRTIACWYIWRVVDQSDEW